jgi:uncharacterized membrane protein|tara:strand:+ start:78 stop:275 length:198 start_codon:yes stop_codon:yes gene_type:complete
MKKLKIMFTFNIVEDYIVETSDLEETAQLVKEIWEKKQNSQNKDIKKNNIFYSIDIIEKYMTEEE